MPVMLGKIIGGVLLMLTGHIVLKVLTALGIGLITFTGVNALLNNIADHGMTALGQLPASALSLLGLMKIGTCVSMLISAYAARAALRWSPTDSIKKLVIGGAATGGGS